MSIKIGGIMFRADPEVVELVDNCAKQIAALTAEVEAERKINATTIHRHVEETHRLLGNIRDLSTQVETLLKVQKTFPIITGGYPKAKQAHPASIPWGIAEKAYSIYAAKYGRNQSLERLAERGGFHPEEMDMLYPAWRAESSEIVRLTAQVATLTRERGISAIWLRRVGDRVEVLAEVNGQWRVAISEHAEGAFSHIAEIGGMAAWPVDALAAGGDHE